MKNQSIGCFACACLAQLSWSMYENGTAACSFLAALIVIFVME